jgi:hypothetical protein
MVLFSSDESDLGSTFACGDYGFGDDAVVMTNVDACWMFCAHIDVITKSYLVPKLNSIC